MNDEIDQHKLIYHPERLAKWCQEGDCFPIYMEIGLTNRCNHRCSFCALDWVHRNGKDIDSGVLEKALNDMAENGVKAIMFAGEGESLLHQDAPSLIKGACQKGLKVAVTTNGVPFNPAMADACLAYLSWIRFSVNAGTAETYANVHRTKTQDFEKVLSHIRYAVELKKKYDLSVQIAVQSLLLPEVIESLPHLADRLKQIGVNNYQVKPYAPHPLSVNQRQHQLPRYSSLKKHLQAIEADDFHIILRESTMARLRQNTPYDRCYGLSFIGLTDAHGNVIPCNLYYENPELMYGNLYQNAFTEIWKSDRRRKVIETIHGDQMKSCRRGCRLDSINRYLLRLKNPHPNDGYI